MNKLRLRMVLITCDYCNERDVHVMQGKRWKKRRRRVPGPRRLQRRAQKVPQDYRGSKENSFDPMANMKSLLSLQR